MFWLGVEWSHAAAVAAGWRVMAKGASLRQVWVNSSELQSSKRFAPDQRHDDSWLEHGGVIAECACSQMKVESMVLVSCALRARASKSCFIKVDFSCSSWAMRSLFSVTSLMGKKKNK